MKIVALICALSLSLSSFASIQTKNAKELIQVYYSHDQAHQELASLMYCIADNQGKYDCEFLGSKKFYTVQELVSVANQVSGQNIPRLKELHTALFYLFGGISIGAGIGAIMSGNLHSFPPAVAYTIGGSYLLSFVLDSTITAHINNQAHLYAQLVSDESSIQSKGLIRKFAKKLNEALQ